MAKEIKNIRKVKQLIRELAKKELFLRYKEPSTPEMIVIEKELQRRGVMDENGSYVLDLPDTLVNLMNKLYFY